MEKTLITAIPFKMVDVGEIFWHKYDDGLHKMMKAANDDYIVIPDEYCVNSIDLGTGMLDFFSDDIKVFV